MPMFNPFHPLMNLRAETSLGTRPAYHGKKKATSPIDSTTKKQRGDDDDSDPDTYSVIDMVKHDNKHGNEDDAEDMTGHNK